MATILFVNACMRGGESRTLTLCREYLSKKSNDTIEEVNLNEIQLSSAFAFYGRKSSLPYAKTIRRCMGRSYF